MGTIERIPGQDECPANGLARGNRYVRYPLLFRSAPFILCLALFSCSDNLSSPRETTDPADQIPLSSTVSSFPPLSFGAATPPFSFLPPLAADVAKETFDGTWRPTVIVCRIGSTGACGSTIATFTKVAVDQLNQQYSVNWKTGAARLPNDTRVLITVFVHARSLGSVTVRLVGTSGTRQKAGLDILVLNGSTLPIKFWLGTPDYEALLFKGQISAGWTGDPSVVALAVNKDGTRLAAIAGSGPFGIGGAVLTLPNGHTITVAIDATGLPTHAVFDNQVIVLFGNFTATTVDLAFINTNNEIFIARGVALNRGALAAAKLRGMQHTSSASLDASDQPSLLALDIGDFLHDVLNTTADVVGFFVTCPVAIAAIPETFGATAAIAAAGCTSSTVSVVADIADVELPNLVESGLGWLGLGGTTLDLAGCSVGDPEQRVESCVQAGADLVSGALRIAADLFQSHESAIDDAFQQLIPLPVTRHNGKIAFFGNNVVNLSSAIVTVDSDGSNRQVLLTLNRVLNTSSHLSWSPDGTRLAFNDLSVADNIIHIFIRDADGTVHQVTSGPRPDLTPAWSPDGTRIAFVRIDPRPNAPGSTIGVLYTVNVNDTSDVRQIAAPSDANDPCNCSLDNGVLNPAWSPDSKRIAVNDPILRSIWAVNADGGLYESVVPDANCNGLAYCGAEFPAWSPDGTLIAFGRYNNLNPGQSPDFGSIGVWLVNVSSGTVAQVLPPPLGSGVNEGFRYPAWSPDGTKLVLSWVRAGLLTDLLACSIDLGTCDNVTVNGTGGFRADWGARPPAATTSTALRARSSVVNR